MKITRYCCIVFLLVISVIAQAQNADAIRKYIATYKDLAIDEMIRSGVPASITLAQGIHESGAGNSKLALSSNNHFGIKCKSNWTGETVSHDDDAKGECFRKYPQAIDSYKDHSDFLRKGQRYSFLFELDPADYKGWADGLKKAGYATNPKYPAVLIRLIEDYQLFDYTLLGLKKSGTKQDYPTVSPQVGTKTDNKTEVEANELTINQKAEPARVKQTYPEGEFKLNETKVVYAKKGTSFLALAVRYKVDLSRIFEFNEISSAEILLADQLVYLQRKRKTGKDDTHEVLPGETLHDIAQEQAIRLESLRELNWLRMDEKPAPGEILSLKKKASKMPKLTVKENFSIVQQN